MSLRDTILRRPARRALLAACAGAACVALGVVAFDALANAASRLPELSACLKLFWATFIGSAL